MKILKSIPKSLILVLVFTTSGQIFSTPSYHLVHEGGKTFIEKQEGTLGGGHSVKNMRTEAVEVDTQGNKVGLTHGDKCFVSVGKHEKECIVCESGKVFEDVHSRLGSATGTPGHLNSEDYIGTVVHENSGHPGAMGSQKRTDYFAKNATHFGIGDFEKDQIKDETHFGIGEHEKKQIDELNKPNGVGIGDFEKGQINK